MVPGVQALVPEDVMLSKPTRASAVLGFATIRMHSDRDKAAEHASELSEYAAFPRLSPEKVLNGTTVAAVMPHAASTLAVATEVANTVVKGM